MITQNIVFFHIYNQYYNILPYICNWQNWTYQICSIDWVSGRIRNLVMATKHLANQQWKQSDKSFEQHQKPWNNGFERKVCARIFFIFSLRWLDATPPFIHSCYIYIWYLFVRHETCCLYDTAQLSQSCVVLISATTCNIRKGADRMLDYQEFFFWVWLQCSTFKSWISLSTWTPSQNPTSRIEFEKT